MPQFIIPNTSGETKLELEAGVIAVLQSAFEKQQTRFDSLDSKYQRETKDLKTQLETAKGQVEILEKKLSERQDSILSNEQVIERVKLHKLALSNLDGITEEELFNLSDRQIKEKVINLDGLDSKSDDTIDGMFEMAIKHNQARNDSFARQQSIIGNIVPKQQQQIEQQYNEDENLKLEEDLNDAYANAWKRTLGIGVK